MEGIADPLQFPHYSIISQMFYPTLSSHVMDAFAYSTHLMQQYSAV